MGATIHLIVDDSVLRRQAQEPVHRDAQHEAVGRARLRGGRRHHAQQHRRGTGAAIRKGGDEQRVRAAQFDRHRGDKCGAALLRRWRREHKECGDLIGLMHRSSARCRHLRRQRDVRQARAAHFAEIAGAVSDLECYDKSAVMNASCRTLCCADMLKILRIATLNTNMSEIVGGV